MSVIQLIINEHKIITNYTKLVNLIVLNLKRKDEISMEDINFLVEFYRIYVDRHHHEVEEIIFPLLMKNNPIETEGIVELIINEHDMGGNFITDINRLIENGEEFLSESLEHLVSLLQRFEFSMTSHIEKENKFLYDLIAKRIDENLDFEFSENRFNLENLNIEEGQKEFLEIRIEELMKFYKAPIYH